MNLSSIIAIYALFWILSAFLVMPFGVKSHEELGVEKFPGKMMALRPISIRKRYCCIRQRYRPCCSRSITSIMSLAG